jgi:hypothetical protein
MPDEDMPAPVEYCGGRLVKQPDVETARSWDGDRFSYVRGYTWRLDGETITAAAAEEFRRAWSQNNSDGSGTSTAGTSSSGETNSSSAPSGG